MTFRKYLQAASAATLISTLIAPLAAHDHGNSESPIRPDTHAPIGLMGEHLHKAGESMLSYRFMDMKMEGHLAGDQDLTSHQVFNRGFSVAALEMDMEMHMFGYMFAPSDKVTLMAMAHYQEMDMTMMSNPHADMDHGGGHGGMVHTGTFSHDTSGWGDTSLSALVGLRKSGKSNLILNLGLSAPTGSVDEKDAHGVYQPYGMQLGSGTWDAKIGATYTVIGEAISWGTQVLGTKRLESYGSSGFGRSDALRVSTWSSYRLATPLSVSARFSYDAEGPLQGHYHGSHNHAAPPHFQPNYGGDIATAHLGLNFVFQQGTLRGHRIAAEIGTPLYQELNGVGMKRKASSTLAWQYAW